MSNIAHVRRTAFVSAAEAQYLKWLDEAAGEQQRLEQQNTRLLAYVRARQRMIECWQQGETCEDDEFHERSQVTDAAWQALIDAGDTTEEPQP